MKLAEEQASGRVAPNQSALEVQQVNFNGQLNIVGAPEGSSFEDNSPGAPAINTQMIGVQM